VSSLDRSANQLKPICWVELKDCAASKAEGILEDSQAGNA
jgi:hypothetical protein